MKRSRVTTTWMTSSIVMLGIGSSSLYQDTYKEHLNKDEDETLRRMKKVVHNNQLRCRPFLTSDVLFHQQREQKPKVTW